MTKKAEYKVEGVVFVSKKEAREYRKQLLRGLPDDTVITIYKAETGYDPDPNKVEWIPTNN